MGSWTDTGRGRKRTRTCWRVCRWEDARLQGNMKLIQTNSIKLIDFNGKISFHSSFSRPLPSQSPVSCFSMTTIDVNFLVSNIFHLTPVHHARWDWEYFEKSRNNFSETAETSSKKGDEMWKSLFEGQQCPDGDDAEENDAKKILVVVVND